MSEISNENFTSRAGGSPLGIIEEENSEEKNQEVKRKRKNKKERKFRKLNPFQTKSKEEENIVEEDLEEEPAGVVGEADRLDSFSPQQLEIEATNMYQMGVSAGGVNEKAIVYFLRSLDARERINGKMSPEAAVLREKLGNAYRLIGQEIEALVQYRLCLRVFRAVESNGKYSNPEQRKVMLDLRKRATDSLIALEKNVGDNRRNSEKMRVNFEPSATFTQKEHVEVFREVERLGDFEGEIGQLGNAIKYYQSAIMLFRRLLDAEHEYVLGAQVKLADTYMRNGEIMQAVGVHTSIADDLEAKRVKNVYFLKVMIYNSTGHLTNDEYASIFKVEKMGDKFLETGTEGSDFEQAIIFYKKALSTLLTVKGIKPSSKHILRIHVKLGTVSWMADETGNMLKAYESALDFFEKNGDKLKEKQEYTDSSHCYTQALRFLLKIKNHEHEIVQRILVKIADIHLLIGRSQAALDLYEMALKHVPKEKERFNRQILLSIANAHEAVGDHALVENDGKSALLHFEKLLHISRLHLWNRAKVSADYVKEARCLDKIGEAYFTNENYDVAKKSYLESLKVLSSNGINRDTLTKIEVAAIAHTNHKLGSIDYFTNNYGEAEKHFEKAIAIKEKIFDPLDKTVLMSKLALCLANQKGGKKDKALQTYSNLLQDFEKIKPNVLKSMGKEYFVTSHQLAKLSSEKGNLEKAFDIHTKLLDHLQSWPIKDPVLIFNTCRNMGELLATKGDFKSAIKYFEMAISESKNIKTEQQNAVNEKVFVRMAYCYAGIDETKKSLEYYSKALRDDPSSIENHLIYNNIGTQLAKSEKYEEALKFFHTSILYLREGENNDIVMMAYNNIGNVYNKIHDEEKAIEYYSLALKESEEKKIALPSFTYYNLGNLYLNRGDVTKSKKFLKNFLNSVNEKVEKGCNNRENKTMKANGLNNLGNIMCDEGQLNDAIDYYREALGLKTEIFGDNSMDLYGTLCNLGSACYKLGHFDSASEYYKSAFDLVAPTDDVSKAITVLDALGSIYMTIKNYDRALESYRNLMSKMKEVSTSEDEKEILTCRYKIGLILTKQFRYHSAIEEFANVYELMNTKLGEKHFDTVKVLLSIAQAHLKLNELDEAKTFCLEAISVLEFGGYDENHPYYRRAKKLLTKVLHTFLG